MVAMARRRKGRAMAYKAEVEARLEKWAGIVAEWEAGAMSRKAFCRRKGIPFSTFGYWRKRLREAAWGKKSAPAETAGFKPVHVVEDKSSSPGLEIILSNDIRIAVREGFEPAVLRAIVAALL